MAKKLSLLLAAVAVIAFAVPAFASANGVTGLTEESPVNSGKFVLIGVNQLVTATNIGNSTVTGSAKIGTITCAEKAVMVEAELKVNTTSEVKAEKGKAESYNATCKNSGEGTATVKNVALTLLKTNGETKEGLKVGTGTVSFDIELSPGGATCHFVATNDTATYNPKEFAGGGHIITITNQPLTVSPEGSCGTTAKLNAKFTIETKAAPNTPLYLT